MEASGGPSPDKAQVRRGKWAHVISKAVWGGGKPKNGENEPLEQSGKRDVNEGGKYYSPDCRSTNIKERRSSSACIDVYLVDDVYPRRETCKIVWSQKEITEVTRCNELTVVDFFFLVHKKHKFNKQTLLRNT